MTMDLSTVVLLASLAVACGCGRTPLAMSSQAEGAPGGVHPDSGTAATTKAPIGGECQDGYRPCGNGDGLRCHDLTRSQEHCGACGHACLPGLACQDGVCQQHRCKGALGFKALAFTRTIDANDTGTVTRFGPALGDFDGDGYQDVVSVPGFNAPMSLSYGVGDGTFPSRQVIDQAALRDWQAAAADLDGDGILDLVSAATADTFPNVDQPSKVTVRRGTGVRGAPFGDTTDYATSSALTSILVADLDADGRYDVAAGVHAAIAYWRGQAGGRFEPQPDLDSQESGTFWPMPVLTRDWNGDGILDLLYGPLNVHYRLGRVGGGFDAEIGCPLAFGCVGDVDHDHRLDLFNTTGLLLGIDGCHASSIARVPDSAAMGSGAAAFADLDGDANLDLVADSGKDVVIRVGDGRGGFAQSVSLPASDREWGSGSQFLFGDLNRDGKLDIVVARTDGWRVLLNTCP